MADRIAWAAIAAAMAVAGAAILWMQRGLTYASDAFTWLVFAGTYPLGDLFTPYQGHLMVVPLLVFKALLVLFGTAYLPFRLLGVALILVLAGLMFEYSRRRVGPWLALAPAALMLGLGSSWSNYLEPMLGAFWLLGIVPGLAALLVLEGEKGRRADLAACALLCLSIASSSIGVAFLVGAAVSVALRGDRRGRAWVVAVPLFSYFAWRLYAIHFGGSQLKAGNVPSVPAYLADSLSVVFTSAFGRGAIVGRGRWAYLHQGIDAGRLAEAIAVTAIEVAVIALVIRWMLRRGPVAPTFWVALGVLATLWIAQALALSPGRTPGEVRYILPGTMAVLLVGVEIARGTRPGAFVVAGVLAVAGIAVLSNLPRFREGRQILDAYAQQARADMAVMELVGADAPPDFNPSVNAADVAPSALTLGVGSYLTVVGRYGSPALPPSDLPRQSEVIRERADALAARLLGVGVAPAPGGTWRGCRTFSDTGPRSPLTIDIPPGGAILRVRSRSVVMLRWFGSRFSVRAGRVEAMVPGLLRIPRAPVRTPWRARLPTAGAVSVCRPKGSAP